jgi:hypothetical protein
MATLFASAAAHQSNGSRTARRQKALYGISRCWRLPACFSATVAKPHGGIARFGVRNGFFLA